MALVSIVSTELVSCDSSCYEHAPLHRSGPMDIGGSPLLPTAVVHVYKRPESDKSISEFLPLDLVRKALILTLGYYPLLTGRFVGPNEQSAYDIAEMGSGAEFISATCNASLDSFRPSENTRLKLAHLPGGGQDFLPAFIPDFEHLLSAPLLNLQHTRFACGSVALGLVIPHYICDAGGFFQFMSDFVELYNGLKSNPDSTPTLKQLPCLKPFLSDVNFTQESRKEAQSFTSPFAQVLPEPLPTYTFANRPNTVGRIIRFSRADLDALKERATDSSVPGFITTFDAIAAHVQQRVFTARFKVAKDAGQPTDGIFTDMTSAVNYRERLNLPARYFANAALNPCYAPPQETLLNAPLSELAKMVHEMVRSVNGEEAKKHVLWLASQPNIRCLLPGWAVHMPMILGSQWSRFAMYRDTVMDVAPEVVGPPFTNVTLTEGLCYFLGTEDQLASPPVDSIDLLLSLPQPIWDALDADPVFANSHQPL